MIEKVVCAIFSNTSRFLFFAKSSMDNKIIFFSSLFLMLQFFFFSSSFKVYVMSKGTVPKVSKDLYAKSSSNIDESADWKVCDGSLVDRKAPPTSKKLSHAKK